MLLRWHVMHFSPQTPAILRSNRERRDERFRHLAGQTTGAGLFFLAFCSILSLFLVKEISRSLLPPFPSAYNKNLLAEPGQKNIMSQTPGMFFKFKSGGRRKPRKREAGKKKAANEPPRGNENTKSKENASLSRTYIHWGLPTLDNNVLTAPLRLVRRSTYDSHSSLFGFIFFWLVELLEWVTGRHQQILVGWVCWYIYCLMTTWY